MAKRSKISLVTASFHYLIKTRADAQDRDNLIEEPFSENEFGRVVSRISNNIALDDTNPAVITEIKAGRDLPFSGYQEIEPVLHFGNFDGAYYGQEYRNNLLGIISADSLNLRPFNYLMTRLRDGKILIGVTYHGQFGDYEGIRSCLSHILRGNFQVTSRAIKSLSEELGNGVPIELKLNYRKQSDRPERPSIFGSSGVIGIKGTEYGDGFQEEIRRVAGSVRGNIAQRKSVLADLVSQGQIIELDSEDIVGCTAIVRENGRTRTVYLLGENNFATKFALDVAVDNDGVPDREQIKSEMIKVMREKILPIMA